MSQLTPYSQSGGSLVSGSSARLPSRVSRAIDHEQHRAVVQGARLHGGALLTHEAVNLIGMLSAEEGRLLEVCPLAEHRVRAVVDAFAGGTAWQIQNYLLGR